MSTLAKALTELETKRDHITLAIDQLRPLVKAESGGTNGTAPRRAPAPAVPDDAVVAYVRSHAPTTPAAIMAATGASRGQLNRLKTRGVLQVTGRSKAARWSVPDTPAEPAAPEAD